MRDPYVDENDVLINKLGITDRDELNKAEADIGFIKLMSVDSIKDVAFGEELIQRIHKHIFEDIFDWAGQYRSVPLVKAELVLPGYSIPYSNPNDIKNDLNERIHDLQKTDWDKLNEEKKAYVFARKMALIWKVHPFRDGNTRTILSYTYLYAKHIGFPMSMELFVNNLSRVYKDEKVVRYSVRDKFVLASLSEKDYPEVEALARLFAKSNKISREIDEENHSSFHK